MAVERVVEGDIAIEENLELVSSRDNREKV